MAFMSTEFAELDWWRCNRFFSQLSRNFRVLTKNVLKLVLNEKLRKTTFGVHHMSMSNTTKVAVKKNSLFFLFYQQVMRAIGY